MITSIETTNSVNTRAEPRRRGIGFPEERGAIFAQRKKGVCIMSIVPLLYSDVNPFAMKQAALDIFDAIHAYH
jgi:hypothetical protein